MASGDAVTRFLLQPTETCDQLLGRARGAACARAFHRFLR